MSDIARLIKDLGPYEAKARGSLRIDVAEIKLILQALRDGASPVAWRVKDFADGWILFHTERAARHESAAMGGALIQPLYASSTPSQEGS